jgi:hypothetical protein
MSQLSQIAKSKSKPTEAEPVNLLPPAYRPDVALLCGCLSDGLRGQMGVVSILRLWIEEHRITPAELHGVVKQMLQPREIGRFQYPMQIIGRLGELVDEALAKRRTRDSATARRKQPVTTASRVDFMRLIKEPK